MVDEVQKEPSILEEIKQAVDHSKKRGQFILTGSAKLDHMKGVSDSLAGRVSVCELGGLSLRELYQVPFQEPFVPTEQYLRDRERKRKPYENIWEIIHRGSYPGLYDVRPRLE